jgi:hypothetical protein
MRACLLDDRTRHRQGSGHVQIINVYAGIRGMTADVLVSVLVRDAVYTV